MNVFFREIKVTTSAVESQAIKHCSCQVLCLYVLISAVPVITEVILDVFVVLHFFHFVPFSQSMPECNCKITIKVNLYCSLLAPAILLFSFLQFLKCTALLHLIFYFQSCTDKKPLLLLD